VVPVKTTKAIFRLARLCWFDILLQPAGIVTPPRGSFASCSRWRGRVPRRLGTDRLGSYRLAHRVIMPSVVHDTTRYANNRGEVSHQPTRRRECHMRRFKSCVEPAKS